MQPTELDLELEELEVRLERLRALYEQYFLGIEKIEPAVARKDVDRRIWTLRREKIRNTAKRFKLQTVIQRYNSYQQYWHRILREIELGTYKRHLRKAQQITDEGLLTNQARRRNGRLLKNLAAAADDAAASTGAADSAPPGEKLERFPPAPELSTLEGSAPKASRHPPSTRPPPSAGILPRPGLSGGRRPSEAPPPGAFAQRPQTLPGTTLSALFAQATGTAQTPAQAAPPLRRAPLPTQPGTRSVLGGDLQPVPPKPLIPAQRPPGAPAPPAKPLAAPAPPPPKPPPPPPKPLAAPAPPPPKPPPPAPKPFAPAPVPKPLAAPPPFAPAPKPFAPAPQAPPQASPRGASAARPAQTLTEDRIQQLHQRLTTARREVGDSSQLSLDGLARSLRATEAKLRQQHQGRDIDFDVTVKDGKAILRPVLKKTKAE